MKIKYSIAISALFLTLTSCSTVKQANTDFKDFCNTIKYYNISHPKIGWSLSCDYCTTTQRCKWSKCPNQNIEIK
jgi:hypothetical protein